MSTVACEEPFAVAIESPLLQSVCHACFRVATLKELMCCSRCSTIYYCSTTCQKHDWSNHSVECKFLVNCSSRVPNGFVRLMARFYLKVLAQGESVVSFNSRTCKDLVDNCTELLKPAKHTENFSLVFNILTTYMHGVDVQSIKTELFSAYGKLVSNAFSITDATGRLLGTGLYLG
ncbi:MYND finger [Dictyocaulus viviparus]|uniref:MYND finger n=1 Tax=Dictyocaulus viviparus TaxID=29172 RepID=A0A0D8XPJ5_DICVI|nr:MYND finger [Dictyocaulus viviparus]